MSKNTKRTSNRKSYTKTNASKTKVEILRNMRTNKGHKRLIDLLGDTEFVLNNPNMVCEDCGDLLGEIFAMELAGNMSSDELNMVASIIINTVNGYRSTHHNIDDFEGLMTKFAGIANETDGFFDLGQEVFGVIKSTYFDAVSDTDARAIAVYICAQACINAVCNDDVDEEIAASESTKVKSVQENKLDDLNLDKFKTTFSNDPKINSLEQAEADVINAKLHEIAESCAKESFEDAKTLIHESFKCNVEDSIVMAQLINAFESVLSHVSIEVLTENISNVIESSVSEVMQTLFMNVAKAITPIDVAASDSTVDDIKVVVETISKDCLKIVRDKFSATNISLDDISDDELTDIIKTVVNSFIEDDCDVEAVKNGTINISNFIADNEEVVLLRIMAEVAKHKVTTSVPTVPAVVEGVNTTTTVTTESNVHVTSEQKAKIDEIFNEYGEDFANEYVQELMSEVPNMVQVTVQAIAVGVLKDAIMKRVSETNSLMTVRDIVFFTDDNCGKLYRKMKETLVTATA